MNFDSNYWTECYWPFLPCAEENMKGCIMVSSKCTQVSGLQNKRQPTQQCSFLDAIHRQAFTDYYSLLTTTPLFPTATTLPPTAPPTITLCNS